MADIESTWATRELPILVAVLRAIDEAGDPVELAEVGRETGLSSRALQAGLHALETADPPYLSVQWASGWGDDRYGGGYADAISERARRELGAWPTPDSLADQLVAALVAAAERTANEGDAERLREAAGHLGSDVVRGVLVSLFTRFVTTGLPE